MSETSYWNKALNGRMTRRRALAATGTITAAAALLAACGGGDDEGGGGGVSSAQLINGKEKDTTKEAKKGGIWKTSLSRDPQNFDLYNFDPFSQPFANVIGTKLLYLAPGHMAPLTQDDVQGDLASSWEISPDKLTATFKLNPNVKWSPLSTSFHAGAPQSIANRQIDSEDILFSWDRFGKTGTASGADELVNSRNPAAPVVSLTAPDKTTVVFKMNKPFSPLLVDLALGSVSYFYILPKEGAGKSDADFFFKWQFGSGPFYIDKFEPSVRLTLKKNPNFTSRDPDRPYVDSVDMTVIPDLSAALAQFRTGNLFGGGIGAFGLSTDDILQVKKDLPEMQMRATTTSDGTTEWFGMNAKGPWKDQRVRQAVQYSWDRNLYIDTIFATAKLEAAGIPANKRWNSCIPCGDAGDYMYFPGMWLDPQDTKAFGENAKWVTLGDRAKDIAEGKKLLAAAGFANGFDFTHLQYPIAPTQQQNAMDTIEGMMREVGLRATKQDKVTIPDIFGIIFGKGAGNGGQTFDKPLNTLDFPPGDVGSMLRAHYHPSGNLFGGWSSNDQGVTTDTGNPGDPTQVTMVEGILGEFDYKKKISLVQDFQRYSQKMFYYSRYPGGATRLDLQWPAVENFNVYRGYGIDRLFYYEWVNAEKRPIGAKTS